MTPSSDWNTAPVSLRIDLLAGGRRLNLRDVDFAHRHHRLEGALAGFAALARQLEQAARRDLPGKAPLVLAPAASTFLAAVLGDRIPIAVGLFLAVGQDHEAHRLVRLEIRAAVEADERLAEHGELNRQLVALCPAGIVGRGRMRRPHVAVGKSGRVEFGGFAALAFVEPQAGGEFVGHYVLRDDLVARTRVRPGPWTPRTVGRR